MANNDSNIKKPNMKASGFLDSLVIEFKQRPSGLRHFLLSGLSIPYATAFPADSATIK